MPAAPTAATRARERAQRPTQQSGALVTFDEEEAKRQIVAAVRAPQRVEQFASLLGGDTRLVDRFITVALMAATSSPKFLKADVLTIVEAVREAAELRLELNGVSGQGYLVPYWNRDKGLYDVQFQPGYRGLLLLVERTEKVIDCTAAVVYEADEFEYEDGSNAFVRHKIAWSDRGNRVGTIAWARLPNPSGPPITKLVPLTEVEAELIRRSSKAADDGPWVNWPDEMRKKSALRRLCKLLPQDPKVELALSIEARAEDRYGPPPSPTTQPRQLTPAGRARAALGIPAGDTPSELGDTPETAPAQRGRRRPAPEPEPVAANADVVDGEAREVDPASTATSEKAPAARVDPSAPGPQKGDPCPMHPGSRLAGGDRGVADLFHSLGRDQGYCRPYQERRS